VETSPWDDKITIALDFDHDGLVMHFLVKHQANNIITYTIDFKYLNNKEK